MLLTNLRLSRFFLRGAIRSDYLQEQGESRHDAKKTVLSAKACKRLNFLFNALEGVRDEDGFQRFLAAIASVQDKRRHVLIYFLCVRVSFEFSRWWPPLYLKNSTREGRLRKFPARLAWPADKVLAELRRDPSTLAGLHGIKHWPRIHTATRQALLEAVGPDTRVKPARAAAVAGTVQAEAETFQPVQATAGTFQPQAGISQPVQAVAGISQPVQAVAGISQPQAEPEPVYGFGMVCPEWDSDDYGLLGP